MAFEEGKTRIRFKPAEEATKRHNKVLKEKIPKLKENALAVLKELKRKYVLVLLSVGKKTIQKHVINHYKFNKIFDSVFICPRKNIEAFKKAKKKGLEILTCKYAGSPDRIVIVGDMISQDIAPGKMIGAETI
jgi:FMN phosphatase YigB (HAD superfamily)